jgi:hypothetical protein
MNESLQNLSRRRWLQKTGGGLGAVGLASLLGSASSAQPHNGARAKRVIQLFMNGGPYQGDLFDPKPVLTRHAGDRPREVELRTERKTAGIMPSPFKFTPQGQSGVPVSELLPRVGKVIDDICVLRSLHSDNPNHGPALLMMNNGTITPTVPSMGAWTLYGLGTENANLPGYVVLCPGRPVRFSVLWNSAFLPAQYQGTYVNHSKLDPHGMIPNLNNAHLGPEAQLRQLALMRKLNQRHLAGRGPDAALEARLASMETAFRMQFEASEAFDLSRESESVREEYGEGHFANGCLLARRLAERGVRFTQVYYGDGQPWDTHRNHNELGKKHCRNIDRPIAALLTDLKRRGLLEDTLVIWGGEFGRTPVSENGNGRDHNHYGFSMFLAGGGVRGGMTHGETDEFGFRAVEDKVHVHDLHATILHLLGLDHERLTYRYAGRDFRLTDVYGRVVREILA